ncbi:MAG TPA: biotin/lipoyl-containing protein [Candidatus Binataceae bacterium]|nr:biotin/lipoyl-containing protein [Candidatus Binataceae bacterium]
MKLRLSGDPREFEVEIVSRTPTSARVRIDGEELEAQLESAGGGDILRFGGVTARVAVASRRDAILVAVGPAHFEFTSGAGAGRRRGRGIAAREVVAPMPGKVLKILIAEGDRVESGAALIVLEAMKMETTLAAEGPAVIGRIRVAAGAMVDHGAVLLELSPPPSDS